MSNNAVSSTIEAISTADGEGDEDVFTKAL